MYTINLLEDKRHFILEQAKKNRIERRFFIIKCNIERRSRLQKELKTKSENQRELILNDETKGMLVIFRCLICVVIFWSLYMLNWCGAVVVFF